MSGTPRFSRKAVSDWIMVGKCGKCPGIRVGSLEKQMMDTRPGAVIRKNFLEEVM